MHMGFTTANVSINTLQLKSLDTEIGMCYIV
jgi:hypothetical protein